MPDPWRPRGQTAGSFETVVNWARGRVTAQQFAAYQHAMQSDVESFRTFSVIKLASSAR